MGVSDIDAEISYNLSKVYHENLESVNHIHYYLCRQLKGGGMEIIMSLGIQIFLKILLYSVIIMVVRGVIGKIQKPKNEITTTEWGERLIDWKIYSIIYMIVGIGFAAIFIFVVSLPSNLEGIPRTIAIVFFVLFILFFFIMSFLYERVYVKIGKDKIYWRKMNGKEYAVRYEDITSYIVDGTGNVKLYQEDKCILAFATGTHKVFVTEVLKNHRIAVTENMSETLTLKSGKGYIILYFVCFLCSVVLLLLCAYYSVFVGFLLFFICAVVLFALIITTVNHKILIEGNTIFEKKLFRKRKIDFSQVEYLSLKRDNNAEIICVHSNMGIVIKIPKSYQNVERFETIAIKKQWRWK